MKKLIENKRLDDLKDYQDNRAIALKFAFNDSRNIFVVLVSLSILLADILTHKGSAWLIYGVVLYLIFAILNVIFAVKYAENTKYNTKLISFILEYLFILAIPIYIALSEYSIGFKILLLIIIATIIITTINNYREIKREWD